ncbi:MAG: hypothetical protein LBB13_00455, partial [Rickettsiales bacterium]|nr:hypothetical protein [Rickettsiales bacterium]
MTKLTNFVFHSSLAIAIIFNIVAVGRAKAEDVNDFEELQGAINNKKTEIFIKNTIDFTANGPVINYSNIVISGPSENAPGLLNGENRYRLLTFKKDAKNILLRNLHFDNGNYKDYDEDVPYFEDGGGAIRFNEEVEANLENLIFSNNHTEFSGGAIFFQGVKDKSDKNNSLIFWGETIFNSNESTDNCGGAIEARCSNLIFKEETKFNDNKSSLFGGAIDLYSISGRGSSLTFEKSVTFSANKSGRGGAINSNGDIKDRNILIFREKATFVGNSGYGTIFAENSSLTFEGLATFEKNTNKDKGGDKDEGGAIYAFTNTFIEFKNGLRLIENSTNGANSGALHMAGESNDEPAIITLIQKNPLVPTEFRGNKSGANGNGRNAVYMERHSQFKFTVEKGNVDVYDVFSGDRNEPDNIITINRDNGWINIEKGGSLENVKVVNRGNLKLAGESRGLNLTTFENSGIIRFEILPGGSSAKINADSITLNAGTVLQIVAIKGQLYKEGESYDILAVNKTKIKKKEEEEGEEEGEQEVKLEMEQNNNTIDDQNINLTSLHRDLKIEGELLEGK